MITIAAMPRSTNAAITTHPRFRCRDAGAPVASARVSPGDTLGPATTVAGGGPIAGAAGDPRAGVVAGRDEGPFGAA